MTVQRARAKLPPTRLGRYEMGARIGGGGMATVYAGRAVRADGSEERVALKLIRDDLAEDEQFQRMFADEAKILARLSHPNVIQTLEYGTTDDHRFIAMELLSGRTYADVWDILAHRKERVPLRLVAWLCARVAAGLHAAHELLDDDGALLGVIHRDVNPGNVFLTYGGEVKLIDFGLAKARSRTSQSLNGVVKGKIPYLAPEQAQGRSIDRRTDIYALGITLWESVTMQRLFKRDTDVATLRAILDANVPDARTLAPDVPAELWGVIDKALRRAPEGRYATADQLRVALDAWVGESTDRMGDELRSLLEHLFPGEAAKQASWELEAVSVRAPAHTLPPPVPVPTASSAMLDEPSGAFIAAASSKPFLAQGAMPEPRPPESRRVARSEPPHATREVATSRYEAWRLPLQIAAIALIILAFAWAIARQ